VAHAVSDAENAQRVHLSQQLPRMLEVQQDRAWQDTVNLEESRFSLSMGHELIRLRQGEKVPERKRETSRSTKFTLTIF
jgi:hypothetical protein